MTERIAGVEMSWLVPLLLFAALFFVSRSGRPALGGQPRRQLGFGRATPAAPPWAGTGSWTGQVDGLLVRVDRSAGRTGKTVVGVSGACPWIGLGKESLLDRAAGAPAVPTGDAEFDAEVRATGDPLQVLALLDAEARLHVRLQVAAGTVLADGELRRKSTADAPAVDRLVRGLTSLAATLAPPPEGPAARLLTRLTTEPDARVRHHAVTLLLADPGSADEAARRALRDPAPAVRALGALHLGDPVALLELLRGDAEIALSVVDGLAATGRLALVAPALPRLRQHAHDGLRRAAVVASGTLRLPGALHDLRQVVPGGPADVVALVEALRRLGDPGAEPDLLPLVGAGDEGVALAAARALGEVGTIAAVPALHTLTEGWFGERRAVARDAIHRIQARAGSPDAGRIAVVEAQAGEVSIAEAQAGAVSIAEREPR